MGNQTTKRTFEVPVCANPDGTLDISPFFQRSPIFAAGRHDWSISYYPESLYYSDSIDLCLQLESDGAAVTISSSVALIDPAGAGSGLPPLELVEESPPMELDHDDEGRRTVTHWVPKSTFRKAPAQYMTPDSKFIFQWTITTILTKTTPPMQPIPMPVPEALAADMEPMPMPVPMPKGLATDTAPMPTLKPMIEVIRTIDDVEQTPKVPALAKTVAPKAGATDVAPATSMVPAATPKNVPAGDVTYSVGGELFHAHKAILAARSPVFMAELSVTTGTGTSQAPATIMEVADMRPDVFEALLHYIYTDTLPSSTGGEADDDDEDERKMMCHLLVAADRYGVEGLKLLCEGKLSEMLDVENVAEMLGFADDHYCSRLKDACVQFMVVSSERMEEVVTSHGYQRLRMKRPSILVDVFEKSLMKRKV